jgi:hypothetical protein
MTAPRAVQDIIASATVAGLRLVPNGDLLKVQSDGPPPAELLAAIRGNKAAILAALGDVTERSAICEHDALPAPSRMPRRLADTYARLLAEPCPAGGDAARWRGFADECGRFLDMHALTGACACWSLADLFSAPGGLLWGLAGREVVALTSNVATMRAIDAPAGPDATEDFSRPRLERPVSWRAAA